MNEHPDLSGVWHVDFQRSRLEIEAPTSSVFTIQHNDPSLLLTRTHRAEGYEDTASLALSTDGRESVHHKGEVEIRSTCVWQGDSLRFRSEIIAERINALNVVVYTMSSDGREMVADETFTGPPRNYHNEWVLVKQVRTPIKPLVKIGDVERIDIRVGMILAVEDVPNSNKLVRLRVDFGDHSRVILAGMKSERANPRDIVGMQALFVVNLEPKRMAGELSEGMLFDIGYSDGITPVLAVPEKPVPNGVRGG